MKSANSPLVVSLVCLPLLLAGACAKESDPGGGSGGSSGSGSGGRGGSTGSRGGTTGGSSSGSGGTTGGSSTGSGGSNTGGGSGSGGSGSGGTGTGGTGTGGSSPDGGGTGGAGGGTGGSGPAPAAMARPFPAHSTYAQGVIVPNIPQPMRDSAVSSFYNVWKQHVRPLCGGYYTHTGGGTGVPEGVRAITISEGHGYGMMAVAYMAGFDPDARKMFDGMHAFWRKFPSINNPDLMAWVILENCMLPNAVTGDLTPDSASDGDLDIAYAYLIAHHQWGSDGPINYLAEAKKVIAAIKEYEINDETKLVLLGDWADKKAPYYQQRYSQGHTGPYEREPHVNFYYGTRPSDFMLDHFRAFGKATGDSAFWDDVVSKHYEVTNRIQAMFSARTGLMPDFLDKTNTGAVPAGSKYLEWEDDGNYAYNACRFPWRIGTDLVVSGDARAKTVLQKLNGWIKTAANNNPAQIASGYKLDGAALAGGPDPTFVAPFGVAAMADASNQAWLDALWRQLANTQSSGYYADTIKLFSLLVMSGNWWAP